MSVAELTILTVSNPTFDKLRFRFRLLTSYGPGSDFWQVTVPVPVPAPVLSPVPAPYLDNKSTVKRK
jgi:hypothetical protein